MSKKRLAAALMLGCLASIAAAGYAGAQPGRSVAKHRSTHHRSTKAAAPVGLTTSQVASAADTYAYWTPERMKSAQPAPMGVPGGPTPQQQPQTGSTAPGSP
jgi:hypothetical protein